MSRDEKGIFERRVVMNIVINLTFGFVSTSFWKTFNIIDSPLMAVDCLC